MFWSEIQAALLACDPAEKVRLVEQLWNVYGASAYDVGSSEIVQADALSFDVSAQPTPISMQSSEMPGRPEAPILVSPRKVKARPISTLAGRRALIHAVCHIEFNAINLALDAVQRFARMPDQYYLDWLSVAWDEARHFQMLQTRLQQLDCQYGDMPAHNGLWEMAVDTAHDVMIRMALVPRVLEARGLDVTPAMINKLQAVGDEETIAVLRVILAEEVRHVEVGTRWFRYCARLRDLDADSTFLQLLTEYYSGSLRGPFNIPARKEAGFSDKELHHIVQATSPP